VKTADPGNRGMTVEDESLLNRFKQESGHEVITSLIVDPSRAVPIPTVGSIELIGRRA